MSNADAEKKEWPVHLYRKNGTVWQRLRPKKPNGRPGVVKAEPQRGSVLLDRVRVRVWLVPKPGVVGVGGGGGGRGGEDSTPKNAVAVRRHDRLLISYHGGGKSLVLKFRDLESCLEFSDLLVRLNPPLARSILAAASASSSNAVPMIRTAAASTARADGSPTNEGPQGAAVVAASNNDNFDDEHDPQMRSFIGRLLLDEDFPKLVDSVEACIRRSADGGQLLAGLMNNERRGSGISTTATEGALAGNTGPKSHNGPQL
jgi:hypothetical protein